MKSMKKVLGAVVLTTAAAVTLAGCAGSGSGGTDQSGSAANPASLTFKVGFATGSPQLVELQKVTKAFEKEHPDIQIKITPDSANYENDMKVLMAANNVPDIFVTHGWSLLRYSPFLTDLQHQPWAKNFNPALAPAMKAKDGAFYALPIDTDISGIVYNESVLKKLGIDPTSIKTWDQFDAVLKTLKSKGIMPISASSKDNWLAGDIIDFMASGAFDESTLKGFTDGTFDTAGYTKLMAQIEGWAKNKYINPDFSSASTDDIAQNLAQGKTEFVFVQNSIIANAKTFDPNVQLGFMPVPTFDGNPFLIGGEDYAIGVSKTSKHQKQALEYLDYLAQPKNIEAQAAVVGAEPGLTNASIDLGGLKPSFDTFVKGNNYPLKPYFDRVYLPNGAWNTMISTVSGVVTGQQTAAAATQQMESAYKSLRTQNK